MKGNALHKKAGLLRTGNLIPLAVIALLLVSVGQWQYLDYKASDFAFSLTERLGIGKDRPTGKVVVVGIDEKSLKDAEPLIFWYPRIGRFIEQIGDMGAVSVSIDMLPVHSIREFVPDSDQAFMRSILLTGDRMKVVQARTEDKLPFFANMLGFMPSVTLADCEVTSDSDDFVRRQKLTFSEADSFANATYAALTGKKHGGDEVMLDYSLKKNIPLYSFKDVAENKVPKDAFKGKAVLLGLTTEIEDVHNTPLYYKEKWIPGVYVHAVAVETLLTGFVPHPVSFPVNAAVLVVLGLAGWALSVKASPLKAVLLSALISVVFFAAATLLMASGLVLAIFPQMVAAPLVVLAEYPYRYFVEEKDRRKLYSTFGRYLDKNIIDSLVGLDAEAMLKGERKDLAVLFSDIRGFTAKSDTMSASDLVGMLNVYFREMTDIVQRHNGVVDKFIGDGLMAFFGTPLDNEGATRNAVLAAGEMLDTVERLNTEGAFVPFIEQDKVKIGIGIHYGVVAVGNIGSELKMDFTVVGRHVNIASRLESLTKDVGAPLLISEAAKERLAGEMDLVDLGSHKVKGIDAAIHVYTLKDIMKGGS